tara:strand:- start:1101 stop:2348 length:1248 start_codon:yes stop_codon:yes gene_type:complete
MANKKIDWSPKNWPKLLFQLFTSFKLATVVLVFMTLITLYGTLAQVELGLFAAKKLYFHSFFVIHDFWGTIPMILPGGLLLMIVLFTNMVFGAIIKSRKRWRGAGLLISHTGMLMLLASGFVTWAFASDGYMALYPGMKSDRVESYRKWQFEIVPLKDDGSAENVWILPSDELSSIRPDEKRVYQTDALPFSIVINGFSINATPVPLSAPISASAKGKEIDGFKLVPQDPAKEAAANFPGCYVEFQPKEEGAKPIEAIISAYSAGFGPGEKPMPFQFEVGGQKYGALLAKKSWKVPFEVHLDEFIFDRHPGISMARGYESKVTRLEEGKPEKAIEIKMNEPMRYEGFTFFQESFGPAGSQPGDRMYSQFAVANNPADQWPLYSLIVTSCGLGIHFLTMLVQFIVRSRKKHAPAKS